MRSMHRRRCLPATALALLAPGTAQAQHIDEFDICSSLFGCLVLPTLPLVLVIIGLLATAVLVMRRMRKTVARRLGRSISRRKWPIAITGFDGHVLHANDEMLAASPRRGDIARMLEPLVGVTATEIYRMSRLAVETGFAQQALEMAPEGTSVLLTANVAGDSQLIWQVIRRPRQAADHDPSVFETAPFGYIRFRAPEAPVTNQVFRDVFADEAVAALREQIDDGVFAAGRIVLPGADGTDRLALSALRLDRSGKDGSAEVFLFVPDRDTSTQVAAAETLDAIPVSLLHLDVEGRVFWGNAQARKMLGDTFKIGRMLGDIVQPLGRSLDGLMRDVRTGRDVGSGDMVRLKAGTFDTFAQISLTHMLVQGQPSLMAVLTDASELRLLEDKFAQSQKMEAVGKLAGGVAHDFNNVLTAISGHCDLLLLRKDASHPDFSDLTQIRQNSNRAAALVKQLLAFSRKQTLQPKLLSVQDVVTDTLYLLDRLIGETITLSLNHGRDLGSVQADYQQLEQALMNLVVNARDAMPNGGMVTISTRNRTVAVEEQRLGISIPAGDYVEISVADEGAGIDEQIIDKVFDPFFTTKPQGEGTGLGLSTVYGIVKQSGGYIYVENLDAAGACFTVLLPRVHSRVGDKAAAQPVVEARQADLTGQGAVMLVEDEAPVRSFASRALKLRGYRVIEAQSAEDAMELLKAGAEDIDVLVSDVVMPGMDGPTFAAEVRKMRPDIRVIFISGYAEDSFRRNLGDTDFLFLPKPFSLTELTTKVKVAMDARPGPG